MPPKTTFFALLIILSITSSTMAWSTPEQFPSREQPKNLNPAKNGFWLTTELLTTDLGKGCLSTALCNKPVFKIIQTMTLNGEATVLSWPASNGDFTQVSKPKLTDLRMEGKYFLGLSTVVYHSLVKWRSRRYCVELPNCRDRSILWFCAGLRRNTNSTNFQRCGHPARVCE